MNSLKKSLLLSLLLLINQKGFSQICINNSSNYKMFGSVLRAGALARGHELAFQKSNFSKHQQFSSETDVELAKQIENMSSGSCSIILGFFTSRECLIAGPILKKNKLIGVSSSCGHNNIRKFSPFLYTIIPPINVFSDKISTYLNENNNLEKIFVIYQPTDVYSETASSSFRKKIKKPIITIPIASDGSFDIKKFPNNINENFTIVFFTYPLPSAKILMQLSEHKIISKRTTILGASCWTFDVTVFRPLRSILEKANSVLAIDVLDWKKVKKTIFVKNFFEKFNREPLTIEILTYDVTKLAINCYEKSLIYDKYDIKEFQNCMTATKHNGVSGIFSFRKNSSFATRELYLTNFLERM
ncbi:MAG: ABC transporter substrate-binding protein [Proteobacteria bacterium]|nr:ABC transporter substrate-binding protein [Pseudomonadota bacterium]